MDMLGTPPFVLCREVVLFCMVVCIEGNFRLSFEGRFVLFQSVFYRRVHCKTPIELLMKEISIYLPSLLGSEPLVHLVSKKHRSVDWVQSSEHKLAGAVLHRNIYSRPLGEGGSASRCKGRWQRDREERQKAWGHLPWDQRRIHWDLIFWWCEAWSPPSVLPWGRWRSRNRTLCRQKWGF